MLVLLCFKIKRFQNKFFQLISGPAKSIQCEAVPHSLIRPVNTSDTNDTMATTVTPEPMDITVAIIGIVIGLIFLVILAVLLVFAIFYIKREDRKKYGTSKVTKPGTDYEQVSSVDSVDQVRRRKPPQNEDSVNYASIDQDKLAPKSDPDVEIETSFDGAKASGLHYADLSLHDPPYKGKELPGQQKRDLHS